MNKIQLANISDPAARSIYKRAMIDAEWTKATQKSRKWSDPSSSKANKEAPRG